MNTALQEINSKAAQAVRKLEAKIGQTPLYSFDKIFSKDNVQLFAKAEWMQLGGSVKARPAYAIIKDAILSGKWTQDQHLLDASSGNTAISYAHISRALGLPLTIVMPENASKERKLILKALGVHIIYSSPFGSTDESQELARELIRKHPDKYFYADQYNNDQNWRAHQKTTSPEIWNQTNGRVTHFVTGLGTTGTFCGTTRGLKFRNPLIECTALQPQTALHGLEGWKHLETARVPGIFDAELVDKQLTVETEHAYQFIQDVARLEGLLLSPSAAANLVGAIEVAHQIESGIVVTTLPDNADKYSELLNRLFN